MSRMQQYRRRMGEDSPDVEGVWLITFTDTIALMLTFFVMTFAMSNTPTEQWEGVTDTIQSNFNRFYGADLHRGPQDAISIERIDFEQALSLPYLKELMTNLLAGQDELSALNLYEQPGSVVLSMPGAPFFGQGSAQVNEEGLRALYLLAPTLRQVKNRIEIIAHTERGESGGASHSSGWDLSLARAAAVSAALQTAGYDKPVTVRGASDGRSVELGEGMAEEARAALAHSIDIVIMEDDGKRVTVYDIGQP